MLLVSAAPAHAKIHVVAIAKEAVKEAVLAPAKATLAKNARRENPSGFSFLISYYFKTGGYMIDYKNSDKKIKTVTLTLTQQCNLSCSYCYEHNKSTKTMSIQTAKEIIDREIAESTEYESIEFDLFGGEAFLEFNLIQEIVAYLCEKKGKKNCIAFITTNGTLVHGKIQHWLKMHRGCLVCGLSLDGTREMHNLNRSNSYDLIDWHFFCETYPQQDVKMTVSNETLPYLAEGVIDLHKKGFYVSCNLAYGINWSNPKNRDILCRELEKLIEFYINNPNIEPCSMLEMGISNIGNHSEEAYRYCGAGISMVAYDVDGERYPCQFFMPLSVGKEKAALAKSITFPEYVIAEKDLDNKCRKCVLKSACPNCYGSNYASTGSIYKRDDSLCVLTKIMMKARSYFRAKQWERGQLDLSDAEIQTLLRAIITIQEKLDI